MKIPNVTIQELLEAGVHLGHKTLRWNPKMKKYIFGKRDSIHIIDLTQTLELINIALEKIFEVISGGNEFVEFGNHSLNARAYISRFNFTGTDQQKKVGVLSGGERNRVHLAMTLKEGGNVILLDEPTNDLDVETLEVLEEKLAEYAGTLMVVSHDRAFLDNTVTSILAFESDGSIQPYVGNYSDWMKRGRSLASGEAKRNESSPTDPDTPQPTRPASARKLSYKLQRELDDLPGVIGSVEIQLEKVRNQTLDSDFYQRDYSETQPVLDQLADLERELEQHLERWGELEEMASALRRDQ